VLLLNDFSKLIPATSALLRFDGYQGEGNNSDLIKARAVYVRALRKFVFKALRRPADAPFVQAQLLGELEAMEEKQGPCLGEFETLRTDLPREIALQARLGQVGRVLRRVLPSFAEIKAVCVILFEIIMALLRFVI